MIKNHLKIAWRNFLKDRQFTLLNLIGLSTGLACTLIIYLWVNDEWHIDKFHQHDGQLYQVMVNQKNTNGIRTMTETNALLARTLKAEMPEVEYAAGALPPGWYGKVTLSGKDKNINAEGQYVDKDYLNMFTYPLIKGNKQQVLTDKNSIVISRELAMRLFHTTEKVIGKTITLQHDQPYLVSGIFKNVPKNSSVKFDFLLSLDKFIDEHPWERNWGHSSDPSTFLMLKKDADIALFNHKIADFMKAKFPQSTETLFVRPYSSGYLYGTYENGKQAGGRIAYVKLFSIIAIFILVIACINFMNLSTARATKRLKEVGVKKAIGASRASLIFQYLGESLLMSWMAVALAIVLVSLFLPQFNLLTGKQLSLEISVRVVLVILGVTLITGLFAGSYPALYLSGFNPIVVLKGKIETSLAELLIRKGLVVFQFSVSVILIIAVIVVYRQIQYIETASQGYNKDNVLTFDMSGISSASGEAFLNEAKQLPGVVKVSGMDHNSLINNFGSSDPDWDGKIPGTHITVNNVGINYDMFETLGLQLAAGRSFSIKVSADTLEAIVNQAALDAMGLKDPIGKHINVFGDGSRTIVGVVKNFHFQSMHDAIKPFVLRLVPNPAYTPEIMARIKTGDEKQSIAQLQQLYQKYHPGYPFEYRFLDDDYQQLYESDKRVAALSRYFGGLAILISCLGLFGLSAFTVERRIKEISVRKVLGATVGGLTGLLSKDFLKLVLLSCLIAFPAAWWAASDWLRSYQYHIKVNWLVFALAGVSAILIALATVSYHAIKAALANPVKSLRSE